MIRLGDKVVATVGAHRAYLAPHVEQLSPKDPQRELAEGMCEYALTVRGAKPYSDKDAIRWAIENRGRPSA